MKAAIHEAIQHALQEYGAPDVAFTVEHPNDCTHGDYATNAALVAAKQMENPPAGGPRECAEILVAKLDGAIGGVARIEIAGPGFINFHLDRSFFTKKLKEARTSAWGTNDTWNGKTVLVEYTDPNPFKEFHVGHLFTNAVGESIARLFEAAGADVKRVNYQGDVGIHVAHAIWGMQQMGLTADSAFSASVLGQAYARGATAYKENETVATEIKELNRTIYERSDEVVNALYDAGREVSLAYFEEIYAVLGTKFDHYFFESEAAPRGKELVLANSDVFTKSDGAYVFDGEQYGLHTRVFINSEGLPTYEAKELALAQMKYEAVPYDHSVVSTSNEITEYFKVLKKAMEFVYPELAEKTEHIGHGTVRLAEGKMSSRTGDVIPARTFIEEVADAAAARMDETNKGTGADPYEVAIAAIKYATLRSDIAQDSVFDRERALSFEGDSGPYLQYTHARICSVLKKAASVGVTPSTDHAPEEPYEVERILYQYPEMIEHALTERTPHHVALFLTELASAFNTFYAREQIADESDEYAPYKALVADAVRQTLANGLAVLGILAPAEM